VKPTKKHLTCKEISNALPNLMKADPHYLYDGEELPDIVLKADSSDYLVMYPEESDSEYTWAFRFDEAKIVCPQLTKKLNRK